jgi:hypothetical protein
MSEQLIHNPDEVQDSAEPHGTVYDELKAMVEKGKEDMELEKRDEAFKNYAEYTSDYYQDTNQARVDQANTPDAQRIKVDRFNGVTMVAQINIDPETDSVIDGHDYNPEAQTMAEIEAAWQEYLKTTPPEERVVIFEGDRVSLDQITERDSAITSRTDSGLLQFLANQEDVEAIVGEPTNKEVADELEKQGVTKEQAALFFTLRALAVSNNNEPVPLDISMDLYFELANSGVAGFDVIPQEKRQYYIDNPVELSKLKQQSAQHLPEWNKILQEAGLPELVISEDGSIGFIDEVTSADLMEGCDPAGGNELSKLSRTATEARDRHLFETIVDTTKDGKKPFIVYGGSHVVSLEPVLSAYYGEMESS